MLDANGRPIEVGDVVATPYDTSDLIGLAGRIRDAILGTVIESFNEIEDYLIVDRVERVYVHLGDGVVYPASEVITLSGLSFVTCVECGFPWPFDVRMNEKEECPDCGALLEKAITLWCPTCQKTVIPDGAWGAGLPAFCPICDAELQY